MYNRHQAETSAHSEAGRVLVRMSYRCHVHVLRQVMQRGVGAQVVGGRKQRASTQRLRALSAPPCACAQPGRPLMEV